MIKFIDLIKRKAGEFGSTLNPLEKKTHYSTRQYTSKKVSPFTCPRTFSFVIKLHYSYMLVKSIFAVILMNAYNPLSQLVIRYDWLTSLNQVQKTKNRPYLKMIPKMIP